MFNIAFSQYTQLVSISNDNFSLYTYSFITHLLVLHMNALICYYSLEIILLELHCPSRPSIHMGFQSHYLCAQVCKSYYNRASKQSHSTHYIQIAIPRPIITDHSVSIHHQLHLVSQVDSQRAKRAFQLPFLTPFVNKSGGGI